MSLELVGLDCGEGGELVGGFKWAKWGERIELVMHERKAGGAPEAVLPNSK